jgi:TolB-like protein/DNA-binding winged helix-turn-helix (wHTH) protein/Tfp pilus assembly protein PilF
MPEGKHFYEFGPFRLDAAERSLVRDGRAIPLTPKAFDTLLLLVENSGHLLSKDELMKRVWRDTFVEEVNLAQNISAIRRALDAGNGTTQYIETVPKGGYRFIAQIRRISSGPPVATLPSEHAPEPLGISPRNNKTIIRRLALVGTLVVLAAVLLFVWRSRFSRAAETTLVAPAQIRSIAVLPLVNLSSDPAQEYFSDGLTDELITKLAQAGSLRVTSRTSVMGYKNALKKAPEIGRELQVDALVEGTVERAGDRVRIRVQLIRTSSDQHMWAEAYDRDLKDILQLESDVTREIAGQIGQVAATQPPQIPSQRPLSLEAHENYLHGRYRWNQRSESGIRAAINYFQKAIELEPRYAQAYAGIADAYIIMGNWRFLPPNEAYPKAEAAAQKALELDDQLAEAHTSLAYANFLYDWDWMGAEKRFRRAIELNPNYATAHHFYSVFLMASGRHSEAQAEIRRARELDPNSIIINSVVGWIYYEGRQYPLAIQESQKTFEMDPNYVPTLLDLGSVYLRTGEYDKAIVLFQRAIEVAEHKGTAITHLAQARALSGDQAEARRILRDLQKSPESGFVSAWDLAKVYAALSENGKALDLLEQSANEHFAWIVILASDPALDPLRAEPRFKSLMQRVHAPRPG